MQWHRSLYWRIALGAVAFLAAMLVVQAMLFVWIAAQSGRTLPGQSPARFAQTIALDLSTALELDPELDVEAHLREQYRQYTHPFYVVLADGRLISIGSVVPSELIVEQTRELLRQRRSEDPQASAAAGRSGRGRRSDRGDRPAHPPVVDADIELLGAGRPMPIIVSGRITGLVVVSQRAPFTFLLEEFAPMLGLVAGAVLVVGTVLTSVLIFGPPRRRLRALEAAARQLGSGDLSARAPERGGDEIAAVANAFNTMADDLAAEAAALAASDRARRQLLADVSHELNTPITAMRGYIETLKMPEMVLDAETRTRYLSIIDDETQRLEHLIGDLLELARLEGGGGTLNITEVSVAQLFDRVIARHAQGCQVAGVTLAHDIAPGATTVYGDRERLEQTLQNLAANARRYAPRGSTLRLVARLKDGAVALSVEDEGPGISDAHLARIFNRFYKADASRHETSGSGLGLSIVKAIVERHGGRISVTSRPGKTVFEITGLGAAGPTGAPN